MTERLELEGKTGVDYSVNLAERIFNETKGVDRGTIVSACAMLIGHLTAEWLIENPEMALELRGMLRNVKKSVGAATKGALKYRLDWSEIRKGVDVAFAEREEMNREMAAQARELAERMGFKVPEPEAAHAGH